MSENMFLDEILKRCQHFITYYSFICIQSMYNLNNSAYSKFVKLISAIYEQGINSRHQALISVFAQ